MDLRGVKTPISANCRTSDDISKAWMLTFRSERAERIAYEMEYTSAPLLHPSTVKSMGSPLNSLHSKRTSKSSFLPVSHKKGACTLVPYRTQLNKAMQMSSVGTEGRHCAKRPIKIFPNPSVYKNIRTPHVPSKKARPRHLGHRHSCSCRWRFRVSEQALSSPLRSLLSSRGKFSLCLSLIC